ncbi:hypothetical protein F5Y19DRAFT_334534 [Xylariaceae sp. FL1651]|nr:hypothetical protein F5Y19DRAFT_334534 [Xylariaceae sp. FL1651]
MAPSSSSSSSKKQSVVYCEGSPSWNPDVYLADTELHARAEAHLANNDLKSAITTSFGLRKTDSYVYHAIVAVTLPQVQHVVSLGNAHGLHNWYYSEPAPLGSNSDASPSSSSSEPAKPEPPSSSETKPDASPSDSKPQSRPRPQPPPALPPPPQPDIEAYLSMFLPSNSAATALRNFTSNAKKGSLRQQIGAHLTSKRFIHPALHTLNKLPRVKSTPAPANPYLAFLSWASRNLEWAGPSPASARGPPSSHYVLPILMHHFGCACPSHEALEILRALADGREILDVGSGNGYWTRLLRDYHAFHAHNLLPAGSSSKSKPSATPTLPLVTPIDSAQSNWRTTWVPDTLITDGATYLRTTRSGARDAVLLLVYPIVGGGIAGGSEGGFTRSMLDAYEGDTVAVVGTQNHNGYTGFRGMTMDEFMAREHSEEWVKVIQVPLPSFPGKDEALYVFQRGPRAPPRVGDEMGTEKSVDQGGKEKDIAKNDSISKKV